MTIEQLQLFFGWCTVINVAILLFWFVFYLFGHDFMYRFHSRMFKMSKENFDTVHYAGLAIFKIGIFLFNFAPYMALRIIG